MTILDRIRRRTPVVAVDDELERLIAAKAELVRIRYFSAEPVMADVHIRSDWGYLVVRDVGLADPDGEARVVGPWVPRLGAPGPDGKKAHKGFIEAVGLPDPLRHHVRSLLREAWDRRDQ